MEIEKNILNEVTQAQKENTKWSLSSTDLGSKF